MTDTIINSYRKRQSLSLNLLLLLSLFIYCSAFAQVKYPELPSKGEFFVDLANIINQDDKAKINSIANNLWNTQKVPLVIVTIESLASMGSYAGIEDYTSELFNTWQLGQKERNYGAILLVSVNDRKSRIEFGAAWEHRYDKEATDIMQNYLVPEFKSGNYSGGLVVGTKAINNLILGLALPEIKTPWWFFPVLIGLVLLLIGVIVSLFKSGRSGWGWALIAFIGIALWFILRNAGSMSGGGSSGGGGATGSW